MMHFVVHGFAIRHASNYSCFFYFFLVAFFPSRAAAIAQLGERQTEDLKVPGSIPGHGIFKLDIVPANCISRKSSNAHLVMV